MKVIFLDVDGVLNYLGSKSYYESVYFVEEEKLRVLAELVKTTGAEIVLSSTWRLGFWDLCEGTESFDADLYLALADALEEFDLPILDCTGPSLATRGEEIDEWLRKREEKPECFIILDDMGPEQFGVYADYLVQTDFRTGLTKEQVKQAIQMLMENGKDDLNHIYDLMNSLLYELEDSSHYSYKPGTKEDGFAYYDKRMQDIRKEIDSRFWNKPDTRNKLYRLLEEEEGLVKSYSQPGAPARWMRANPKLRFYDCVFDFIEESPELYDLIRGGEFDNGLGQAIRFSFYPTKEECEARKRYFAELEEKNVKQNSQYSFDRWYQNELVNAFRIIFEAEFA